MHRRLLSLCAYLGGGFSAERGPGFPKEARQPLELFASTLCKIGTEKKAQTLDRAIRTAFAAPRGRPLACALRPRKIVRGGGRREHAHGHCGGRVQSPGAGTRGGAKRCSLPPRAPMYAFYSLLIYIFYSLFRRDGGAAVATDPGDPTQVSGVGLHPGRLPPSP